MHPPNWMLTPLAYLVPAIAGAAIGLIAGGAGDPRTRAFRGFAVYAVLMLLAAAVLTDSMMWGIVAIVVFGPTCYVPAYWVARWFDDERDG